MLDVQEVRLRFIFVRALYPVPLFSKALGNAPSISKRTWMSVVLRSSDVFATQKLASRSVHGCTLLDSLFQKAYVFAPCNCRTDKDVREIEQRRVCPANSTLDSVDGSILLDARAMLVAENKLSLKLNN